jgi:hypothetical protein
MAKPRQVISERAIDFLENNGYLNSVRAEMKAEVITSLVELEEDGKIPPSLRINRYTPSDDLNKQAIAYVLEFLTFHKLSNSIKCLIREVNGDIETLPLSGQSSLVAQKIGGAISDDGNQ